MFDAFLAFSDCHAGQLDFFRPSVDRSIEALVGFYKAGVTSGSLVTAAVSGLT